MELLDHCKTGNLEAVRQLLVNGTDPNFKDYDGCTALHEASRLGHFNIVQELLRYNANVNERNQDFGTPLHLCSTAEIAKLLIQNGANIKARDSQQNTPLHYASNNGFADVVYKLINNNGADMNVKCKGQFTPLHWASQNGHIGVVQVLIENGAELNEQNVRGDTPLHYASSIGHLDVVKILGPCVDWELKNNKGQTSLDVAKTDEIREVIKSFEFLDIKEPEE